MVQPVILRFRGQPAGLGEGVETYQADVVAAPGRGWGGPFQSAGLKGHQIEAIRQHYRGYVSRYQRNGDSTFDQQELHLLRLLGNQLFEMLPETVQDRLRQVGANLALTLQFEPSAYPLLDLPWELVHDPAGYNFYALQGGGITRQLLPALPGREFTSPQSMLGLWAAPAGLPSLSSRQQFQPAPGHRGQPLKWLEGANSLEQLAQTLDDGLFDGLHLVAHGRPGLTFALGFVAADGSAQWLDSDRLATLLGHYPNLQLLYLDVCNGEGQDEGGLVAFVRGVGLPAVILMQDEMGQEAAGRMAQAFYQTLGKGATLGEAVTAGRRAIRIQGNDPIQWSIPALYTRPPTPKSQSASPLADWVLDQKLARLPLLWLGLALALLVGHLSYQLAMVGWDSLMAILLALPYLLEAGLLPIVIAVLTRSGQAQLQEKYQLTGRDWLPVLLQKYFGAFLWSAFAWLTIWLVWAGIYMGRMERGLAPAGKQSLWVMGLALVALAAHLGARQAIRQNLLFLQVGFVLFRKIFAAIFLFLFGFCLYLFVPLLILGGIYSLSNGWSLSADQREILFIAFVLFLTDMLYLAQSD